tara:strand:+ start:308 stop:457 length:150 start_codon:yes stop_codon:yes gene_type:complete
MNIAIVIVGVLLLVASFMPQVAEAIGSLSWLLLIVGIGTLTFGVTTNSD